MTAGMNTMLLHATPPLYFWITYHKSC